MIKHLSLRTIAFGCCGAASICVGQISWLQSENCHINARTADERFQGRSDVIDATFKWYVYLNGTGYECSGVLMNRNINQDDLGFYFSTARHCINPNLDLDAEHEFMFHYESPTGLTDDTETSNRGRALFRSTSISPTLISEEGFEYLHKSRVELVRESTMADYALLRMVTPPPAHFNLYYAGWHPSSSGILPITGLINPCDQWHGYVLPNHPRGDIKKINGAAALQNPTAGTYVVCNVVTTVIDVLFGWIWGNTSSTQVICSYTDIPWYTVEWCDHGVEGGSSGSPFFNASGRFVGPLSGLGNPCSGWVPTTIGKFKNVYPFAAIKNALNPSHDLGIDLWGIGGRRISCNTNLDLPGGGLDEAYYFPANHYQSDNRIALRAQHRINVVAPITILNGAHYEFLAGESVELNGLVDVRPGATFVAAIEGCTKSMENNSPGTFAPSFVRLPKKLTLVDHAVLERPNSPSQEKYLTLFPNPAHNIVHFRTDLVGPWDTRIIGPTGTIVRSHWLHAETLNVSGLSPGIYHLRISDANGEQRTGRLVISD